MVEVRAVGEGHRSVEDVQDGVGGIEVGVDVDDVESFVVGSTPRKPVKSANAPLASARAAEDVGCLEASVHLYNLSFSRHKALVEDNLLPARRG